MEAGQSLDAHPREIRVISSTQSRRSLIDDAWQTAREVYRHRFLLQQIAARDIRIRYRQALLGFAWALLMPVLIVAAGLVVRHVVGLASGTAISRVDVASTAVKSVAWGFFAGTLGFAVNSVTASANLLSKMFFPRAVLPLASLVTQAADSALAALLVALLLPALGVRPSWAWIWVPALLVLLLLLTLALALVLSAANVFFRDVKYLVQVALTFGILFTPVLFHVADLGLRWARPASLLNPLTPLLEGLRLSVVSGHPLHRPLLVITDGKLREFWEPTYLAIDALLIVASAVLAVAMFRRAQTRFAERV